MTNVRGIYCDRCNVLVFSRARHDFRWCPCGYVGIDGGFDYTKITHSASMKGVVTLNIKINQTKKQLYDDWNKRTDKYGILKYNRGNFK